MALGLISIACVVIFVACAFLLRRRMESLGYVYEAQLKAMAAAELVLLSDGNRLNMREIERDSREAAANAAVMRKHKTLFRLLWPHEYDRAYYSGERLIAQSRRLLAISSR
jgi:hypothetical protein